MSDSSNSSINSLLGTFLNVINNESSEINLQQDNLICFDTSLNRIGINTLDPTCSIDISGSDGEINVEKIVVNSINTKTSKIKIGDDAGNIYQGQYSIAIGDQAGYINQDYQSIAIGLAAGYEYQNYNSIAIGNNAGRGSQGSNTIAIGYNAGHNYQDSNSVAIGFDAGNLSQERFTVAIGYQAGKDQQGQYSIAIGSRAGFQYQATNSIILNATGTKLENRSNNNSFYVKPIKQSHNNNILCYNNDSGEITYNNDISLTNVDISNHLFVDGSASFNNVDVSNLTINDTLFSQDLIIDVSTLEISANIIDISKNYISFIISDNSLSVPVNGLYYEQDPSDPSFANLKIRLL